jgi:hypothetical protein
MGDDVRSLTKGQFEVEMWKMHNFVISKARR